MPSDKRWQWHQATNRFRGAQVRVRACLSAKWIKSRQLIEDKKKKMENKFIIFIDGDDRRYHRHRHCVAFDRRWWRQTKDISPYDEPAHRAPSKHDAQEMNFVFPSCANWNVTCLSWRRFASELVRLCSRFAAIFMSTLSFRLGMRLLSILFTFRCDFDRKLSGPANARASSKVHGIQLMIAASALLRCDGCVHKCRNTIRIGV